MRPVKPTKNLANLFSYSQTDAKEKLSFAINHIKDYFETHVISIDNVALVDTHNDNDDLRFELYLGIDTAIAEFMVDIMCVRHISLVSRKVYTEHIEAGNKLENVIVAKLVKSNENGVFEYCDYFIQFTLPTFSFYQDVFAAYYTGALRKPVLDIEPDAMAMSEGYKISMCPEFTHKDEYSFGLYVDDNKCFIKFTGLRRCECSVSTECLWLMNDMCNANNFRLPNEPPIDKLKDIDIPSENEEYQFITDNGILSIIASSLRTKECTEDEIRTIIYKLVSQHRINSYRPKKERDE